MRMPESTIITALRAELAAKQALSDLCHKRTLEADKLWQEAHNMPGVYPDLGELITWLMKRADIKHAALVGVCENCPNANFGPQWCNDCDIYSAREGK